MFVPIATAHPYSAQKFTCYVMHRAHVLNTKMNNDRADNHFGPIYIHDSYTRLGVQLEL